MLYVILFLNMNEFNQINRSIKIIEFMNSIFVNIVKSLFLNYYFIIFWIWIWIRKSKLFII